MIQPGIVMIVQTTGEDEKIMNDTKRKSFSEAFVNSFGSYPIGYAIGLIVLPLSVSWIQKDPYTVNILITLVYASVSFVRIYFLRRLFVKIGFDDNLIRLALKLHQKTAKRFVKVKPKQSDPKAGV